jgi:hypothetical protein
MKFFIPHAKDKKQELEVYISIKKFAEETTNWKVGDKRIYHLSFLHHGREQEATVGEVFQLTGEEVIAILNSDGTYLVCTSNRGVARGTPILVGQHDTMDVDEFEEG